MWRALSDRQFPSSGPADPEQIAIGAALDVAARLEIPHHAPRQPWADKRADGVGAAHQELAARDVGRNHGGRLADELDRDLMRAGRVTALSAFGIGDDAVAPAGGIGPQCRLAITATAHGTALRCPLVGARASWSRDWCS